MNCDPIARWYWWLEYAGFGGALQRRRVAFLGEVADARRVLMLGEGDGRFLVRLVAQNATAAIDYVDLSGRMLQEARKRAGTQRVVYHRGDALTIPLPPAVYDLVCAHFFLDCLNEGDAAALVNRIATASASGGRWLISEFRDANRLTRAMVRALYFFFRVTTGLKTQRLVDHRPLLERAGLHLVKSQTSLFGLLVSELWIVRATSRDTSTEIRES